MKVSSNAQDLTQAQGLIPVLPNPTDDSSSATQGTAAPIDARDPHSFDRLLSADRTGVAPKGLVSIKPVIRHEIRRQDASTSISSVSSASKDQLAAKDPVDKSSAPSSNSAASNPADKGAPATTGIPSDADNLPTDPRLQQTPAELALEAAAIAAAAALAQAAQQPSTVVDTTAPSDSVVDVTSDAGAQASQPNALLDQLVLRALQASFRSGLAAATAVSQSSQVSSAAPVQSQSSAVMAQGSSQTASTPVQVAAQKQPSVPAPVPSVDATTPSLPAQPQSAPASLPIDAPLVSVSATSAQAVALAASGQSNFKVASTEVAAPLAVKAPVAEPPPVQPTPVPVVAVAPVAPYAPGALASAPSVGESVEEFSVPLTALDPTQPTAAGVTTTTSTTPAVLGVAVAPVGKDASSGDGGSQSAGDESPKDQTQTPVPQASKASSSVSSRPSVPPVKSEAQTGTLGATGEGVSKVATSLRSQTAEDNTPIAVENEVRASVADKATAELSPSSMQAPVVARPVLEVAPKPVVLPPVQARANEVWKVVQDAVQRARSENPSHLAVDVRMDDGSTLGVEVRMSNAGLQASFRSDSQNLLKSIEAQWNTFVSKETADAKVTSAVFEGRTGLGTSSDSSSNGSERRQQMQDASDSAALSRGDAGGKSVSSGVASKPIVITPSIRTRDGRVSVYA